MTTFTQETNELLELTNSSHFIEVRRRVFRQLVESLLYENIVLFHTQERSDGQLEFSIQGRDIHQYPVTYVVVGRKKQSFGRIRLSKHDVMKRYAQNGEVHEATEFSRFLYEITPSLVEEPRQVEAFVSELLQTHLHDTQALYYRSKMRPTDTTVRSYADLEGDIMDGHPYHPCYKSRIGFSLTDNRTFGPDFNPVFSLYWIAVHKELAQLSASNHLDLDSFFTNELEEDLSRFRNILESFGLNHRDYLYLPVHPWQWDKKGTIFYQEIAQKRIVPLGLGSELYSPQQSIRTLSNRIHPEKANIKVSLNIRNTSALRNLGTHHIQNAPSVSDWLSSLFEMDPFLSDECRVILLQEFLGITIDTEKLPVHARSEAYGKIGTIWRDSVFRYLEEGEEAVPFTALCHLLSDGTPFISRWVESHGLLPWVHQVLRTAIRPMIHLMYSHGIALESHAQNLVLIHRKGMPSRIAIRDLPGGIRYYTGIVKEETLPNWSQPPVYHANHGSSMATSKAYEVRDYLLDAFFHINLAEFAMFLEEHFQLHEYTFWSLALEIVQNYQMQCSHLSDRFELFDLFDEEIEVGQLTIRRLCGESSKRDHVVPNPFYYARKEASM